MDCKIIKNTEGERIGVEGMDGKSSQTFQEILNNPNIKDFDEALSIYKNIYSDKLMSFLKKEEEPKLKYQTTQEEVFSNYADALRSSNSDIIKAGINTVDGFKELFSINTNSNINSPNGLINHLVRANITDGLSYKQEGKTHLKPAGKTNAKQAINAEIIKEAFRKQLGIKTASINVDNTVKISEDQQRNTVTITNKKGERQTIKISDLDKPYSELKKEYDIEMVAVIQASQIFEQETAQIRKDQNLEFIPENELQDKTLKLLQKFGIKTVALEDYLERHNTRNNVPISARALVDLSNKLIAFKDGIIEEDTLLEEVSHLIEASIPMEQKENVLRNIHKTEEWLKYASQYEGVYKTDLELRREILGKVIANSLKEQFSDRNNNPIENSILAKIREFFSEFMARITGYFQESYIQELNNIEKEVFRNLFKEELNLNLSDVNQVFFNNDNASLEADKIFEKTRQALESLKEQEYALGKQYQNSANKALIKSAERSLNQESIIDISEADIALNRATERLEKINGVAQFVRLVSSQTNTLINSAQNAQKNKYPLSKEENSAYQSIKRNIQPALSSIKNLLNPKDKIENQLIEELKVIIANLEDLTDLVTKGNKSAVLAIMEKTIVNNDMSEKEASEYREVIKAALEGAQKDTDMIHAHIGSLLMARNPLLNLAGLVTKRTTLQATERFQPTFKKMANKLNALNWQQKDFESIIDEKVFQIINEQDPIKVAEKDKKDKEQLLNEAIQSSVFDYTFIKDITETDFNKLRELYPNETEDLNILEKIFNKIYSEKVSKRRENYFESEYIKRLKEHSILIDGKNLDINDDALQTDADYRRQSTQIRINAKDNLTATDKAQLKDISRKRQEDSNSRSLVDGSLISGIKEAYDEQLQRYVVVKDSEIFDKLNSEAQKKAEKIIGLNHISYKNQDFYRQEEAITWAKKEGKKIKDIQTIREEYEIVKPIKELPQAFLDKLASFSSNTDKLKFIEDNAYISFPDSHFEQFKMNSGVVSRLRENGSEKAVELIKLIRAQQGIINRVLRVNSVHNKPSETDYPSMQEAQKNEVRLAQTTLDGLYSNAKLILGENVVNEELSMETLPNQAFFDWLKDSGEDKLQFILKNVTPNNVTLIGEAKENLEKGRITKLLTRDMSEQERQEAFMKYAESKLLPYLKKTEPIGFSEAYNQVLEDTLSVEDFIKRTDLIKVSPSFSFYETENPNINKKFIENQKQGKEQWTEEYLKEVRDNRLDVILKDARLKEGREAILEYYDTMIDNNNLTGRQSRYMIPGVRSTHTQRIQSGNIKEIFKDMVGFRPEDQIKGGINSNGLFTVPTYYTKPLDDIKEQTKDYLYAFAMYGQAASLHKSRRDNINDMFILEDALVGVESQGKNTLKMFNNFMEYNFYGKTENFSKEVSIGTGRKIDLGKVAKTLNGFAKMTNLMGLVVPLTSAAQATVQKNMESVIGEVIDSKSSTEGNKFFVANAGEMMKETMGFKSNATLNVFGEAFGLFNILHRYENSQLSKPVRAIVRTLDGSSLHELGNFPVVSRAMCGIIASYRYVDGRILSFEKFKQKMAIENFKGNILTEWGNQESILKDFESAVKDGVLDNEILVKNISAKLKLSEGVNAEEYILNKKEEVTLKVQSFINRIDSQIPQDERSILARDSLGTFLVSHTGWLLSALPRRFKGRHYNHAEQTFQEGTYVTVKNFLYDVIANPKGIKDVYNTLDTGQKANLKRTLIEIGYANALAVFAILLAGMVDDDEDPMYALALADLIASRTAVEQINSTVGLPSGIWQLTSEPIMLKRKLEDWSGIMDIGDEKKASKYLKGVIPFMRDIEKLRDPKKARQSYIYFQENQTNLYDRYAVLSNFFDEE